MANLNRVMRPLRCEQGHALGGITRDHRGVSVLYPFRHAVMINGKRAWTPEEWHALDENIFGGPLLWMRSIRCDICGGERDWHLDRKMLEGLNVGKLEG